MAYAKKTLSDCLQSLADRHESNGELPTSSATLAFWTRLLNKGVEYCVDRLRLTKDTSLAVSSGSVALPDDFITINSVYLENTSYAQVGEDEAEKQVGTTFWITGNHIDGFYLNAPADDTYTVNYSFRPAPMVSGTDVCVIPDVEAPVAYAYAMIRRAESDPFEDAATALDECDARLTELQSAKSVNDNSLKMEWN